MTALAPHLARFLGEHLPRDQRASPHTCDAYAYSFQLLVTFAAERLRKLPSQMEVEDIGVPLILAFLDHIEQVRGNTARSRNARLAAIRSFFRFLEYRVPVCLDQSLRIRAIPMKKTDEALVASLTRAEVQALIDAPDPRTISGARDRAMLHLAFSAGLRVSELVGLRLDQLDLRNPCSIHVIGKGRRERVLPLWKETVTALQGLALRSRAKAGWGAISQCLRPHHDPLWVRIYSRHACGRCREKPPLHRSQARDAPCPASQLRNAYAASHARCSQGGALAGSHQSPKHRSLPSRGSDRKA